MKLEDLSEGQGQSGITRLNNQPEIVGRRRTNKDILQILEEEWAKRI